MGNMIGYYYLILFILFILFIHSVVCLYLGLCYSTVYSHLHLTTLFCSVTSSIHLYALSFRRSIVVMSDDDRKHLPDFTIHVFMLFSPFQLGRDSPDRHLPTKISPLLRAVPAMRTRAATVDVGLLNHGRQPNVVSAYELLQVSLFLSFPRSCAYSKLCFVSLMSTMFLKVKMRERRERMRRDSEMPEPPKKNNDTKALLQSTYRLPKPWKRVFCKRSQRLY
jgi:hypothetical protein